jgi:RNA polymerase sigma-70 factor (ECF subfamily)
MDRQTAADDIATMKAIAGGDPLALEHLYDRYHQLVFAICLRVLHETSEAEDVLVEVFQELWERSQRYDSVRGSPLTYLSTLARSRAIDHLRSRSRDARQARAMENDTGSLPDAANIDPGLAADLQEQRQKVVAALGALDPDYRQAVELSFYDGLSHSEIASHLDKPLGTVKTYIRQGLIQLRDQLRTPDADHRDTRDQ